MSGKLASLLRRCFSVLSLNQTGRPRRSAAPQPALADPLESRTLLSAPPAPVSALKQATTYAAYFADADSRQLWRTNGTPAGTFKLINVPTTSDVRLHAVGRKVFFINQTAATGRELWVTDGTVKGTRLVKDILPGKRWSEITFLGTVGNSALFTASDGAHGTGLWRSDGSAARTLMLQDISKGRASSSPANFTGAGGYVYFSMRCGQTTDIYENTYGLDQLWRTDGTRAGTVALASLKAQVHGMTELNGQVIVRAQTGTRVQLWRSVGTVRSTVQYASIFTLDPTGGRDRGLVLYDEMIKSGDKIFFHFIAERGGDVDLFTTDGRTSTFLKSIWLSPRVSDPQGYVLRPCPVGSTLYFVVGSLYGESAPALWKSDGTPGGTVHLQDFPPGFPPGATVVAPNLANSAFVQVGSYGLWSTDGTESGTVQTGLELDLGSSTTGFPSFAGKSLFIARDQQHGMEFWTTDGTVAGTSMVMDINPGAGASVDPGRFQSTMLGNRFIFVADDGVHGRGLWIWNTTTAALPERLT